MNISCHSGYTVLANRSAWQVADDMVPLESPESDNSWCGGLTSSCWKEPWSRSCKIGKRNQGEFDYHTLLHNQAVMHILLILTLPLHLLLLLIILLLLLPILLLLPLLQEVWMASPFPAGTCRTGPRMYAYRPGLLLPPGSKIMTRWKFSHVTKLWQVLQDSDFQMLVTLTKIEELI